MKEKELKFGKKYVGATIGRPPFEEYTRNKNFSKSYSNLTSNSKAITLIALIIAIIVMLILVGVTISVAINGGLFANAKQAKTDTQNAINAENELSEGKINIDEKIYNSIDEYLENVENHGETKDETNTGNWTVSEDGNTVTDGSVTLNIGDYVAYTPSPATSTYSKDKLGESYTGLKSNSTDLTTEESLKWRILGIDTNGCLTLISDKPTSKEVNFKNAVGYNNGVYILNDICKKLYSNSALGIIARSLSIEDIEAGFSEIGTEARDECNKDSNTTQYNNPETYTNNLNYPVIYAQENDSGIEVTEDNAENGRKKDGIGGSVAYYNESQLTTKPEGKESDTATEALTCTQTYYYFSSTPENYCKNKTFYTMIFGTSSSYWLASRFVGCNGISASFGLRFAGESCLDGTDLFDTNGDPWDYNQFYLRPVISLGSNIKISKCEGRNSERKMHTLSKAE